MADLLGQFIKHSPRFKGKGRLREYWLKSRTARDVRLAGVGHGLGMKLHLHVPYEAMVWLQQEEVEDLHRLRQLLVPGGLFVDVGANIGLWTLTAAQALGENGKVIAFEPNPATFIKLTENISLNRFESRVESHQVALSASRGSISFICRPDHNNSRIAVPGEKDTISIPTAPLADFVGEAMVTGMKIDVEGYEFPVLQAARPILERSFPWLVVEFNTLAAGTDRLGDWPVFQLLEDLGYGAFLMDDRLLQRELAEGASFKGYLNILFHKSIL
jgi:FkbM family methyltransferase